MAMSELFSAGRAQKDTETQIKKAMQEFRDERNTASADQKNKADGGKTRPGLLEQGFPRALRLVQATLDYGAEKYSAHSWMKVEDGVSRYNDAARRHRQLRDMEALPGQGFHAVSEACDEESGLPHIAHEIVCLLMLIELDLASNEDTSRANNTLQKLLSAVKKPPTAHKGIAAATPAEFKTVRNRLADWCYDGVSYCEHFVPVHSICPQCIKRPYDAK